MREHNGLPGIGTERTSTPLNILVTVEGAKYFPGGKIIDGSLSRDPLNTDNHEVLRAGMLMGIITATGLLAPSVIGKVLTDTAANAKTLVVSEQTGDEVERRCGVTGSIKLVGAPTDTGTVAVSGDLAYTSIDAAADSKRTINLTENAPAVYVDGSFVCAIDGSHIPVGILNTPSGVKVTDDLNASVDVECPELLISGQIIYDNIINAPADALTTLKAWMKAYLRASGLGFLFNDDFGE
jgi:hypothetical protein